MFRILISIPGACHNESIPQHQNKRSFGMVYCCQRRERDPPEALKLTIFFSKHVAMTRDV
jgi:hypothetical protein